MEGSPGGSRRVRFDASFVRREWNVRGDIPEDSKRGKQCHLKLLLRLRLLTILLLSHALTLCALRNTTALFVLLYRGRLRRRRRRRVLLCRKERERVVVLKTHR